MTDQVQEITQEKESGLIDFDKLQSTSLKPEGKPESESEKSGDAKDYVIDPELAIFVLDSLIVRFVSFGARQAGYLVQPKELSLTAEERKRIKPLAEKSMKRFLEWFQDKFPDHAALILALILIYGSKLMHSAKKIEKKKPENPELNVTKKPARKSYTTKNIKK